MILLGVNFCTIHFFKVYLFVCLIGFSDTNVLKCWQIANILIHFFLKYMIGQEWDQ